MRQTSRGYGSFHTDTWEGLSDYINHNTYGDIPFSLIFVENVFDGLLKVFFHMVAMATDEGNGQG